MVKSTLKDAQHHGDANQNHTEIPYHTHQDSYYQPKSSQAKPNQKITSVGKNVDKSGTLLNCCWEYKMVQLLWKTWWFSIKHGMVVPEKKQQILPYDPAIPLLDSLPPKLKAGSQRDYCTSMFIVALFTTAKRWKQTKCPLMDE